MVFLLLPEQVLLLLVALVQLLLLDRHNSFVHKGLSVGPVHKVAHDANLKRQDANNADGPNQSDREIVRTQIVVLHAHPGVGEVVPSGDVVRDPVKRDEENTSGQESLRAR